MSKKLVYRHFIGLVKDSDEISLEFDNGTISAYLEPRAKQWSGPQDGLPPIGMTVYIFDEEPHDYYAHHVGSDVEVVAHSKSASGEPTAVYQLKDNYGDFEYHALVADCFRPTPCNGQLAAEQRETAIREIMDIADVDCRVTAARLVDAGFKREVV